MYTYAWRLDIVKKSKSFSILSIFLYCKICRNTPNRYSTVASYAF